jgi:hypothetical protein
MSSPTGRSQDNYRAAAHACGGKKKERRQVQVTPCPLPEHSIEHGEKFAHAGGELRSWVFANSQQACVTSSQDRISASGDQALLTAFRTSGGNSPPHSDLLKSLES